MTLSKPFCVGESEVLCGRAQFSIVSLRHGPLGPLSPVPLDAFSGIIKRVGEKVCGAQPIHCLAVQTLPCHRS